MEGFASLELQPHDAQLRTLFDAKQVTKFVFEGVVRGQDCNPRRCKTCARWRGLSGVASSLLPLCALEFKREGGQPPEMTEHVP